MISVVLLGAGNATDKMIKTIKFPLYKTDYTRDKDLSCHTSSCIGLFNREHVYAKSIATPLRNKCSRFRNRCT